MTAPPSVADRSPEEVLRRLELAVVRRLDGMLQGDYRGLVPGHGTEAGDARAYVPGDDVRRIDWNVTARTTLPHVRDTVADRELETRVLVDLSASLDFGTAACEKRDLAVAAVAAVGFLTARLGNRIGAVVLQGSSIREVPPRPGRDHLLALLHTVVAAPRVEGGGPADLAAGLSRLAATARRRGLVVVVSDFLADRGWEQPLRAVASRQEVLAVEVVDPRELELPAVGVLTLVDPETGRRRDVQTANAGLRARYAAAAAEQRAAIAAALRAAGADHLVLRTDSDWLVDLVRFVAGRRTRVQARARLEPLTT
ncbi:MAG TPA: DUF58 domain-containing protein [Acidimicrobiales bacterium]